jgi:hypothetical protein
MNKKFKKTLRPDLTVRRTGFLGMGRKLEVSGGGLTYRVDRRTANAETAAYLNSKIPVATIKPKP